MAVTFILGRAGAGKTRYCLDALTAELASPVAGARLLFLVPEQASFQMERELALRDPRRGYSRAEVLSFSRLARGVFDELGREPSMLRTSARALALRSAAGEQPDDFRAFGAAAETPGFFKQLDRFLEELFVENVSPDEFERVGERSGDVALRRRVEALARIYRRYLEWLGPERLDPALRLQALREKLTQWPDLREAKIWVDGFAGFTGQELATLVTLAGAARETSITLLLDPQSAALANLDNDLDELSLFHRTETTYQNLRRRLAEEGVDVRPPVSLRPNSAPRFAKAPMLSELERGLAAPGETISVMRRRAEFERKRAATRVEAPPESSDQIRVIECETHQEEIRAAARFVRESVRLSGGSLHYRDFALIARDLNPFADAIADAFTEYEIPHFIDRRRSLGAHVLARFVQGVLETLASDFSTAATTRLLRSGLAPLAREHAELLENVVAANQIRGLELWRREHWKYEWTPRVTPPESELLDAGRQRIVRALAPLAEMSRQETPPTGVEWARALSKGLADLCVPDRLASWMNQARLANDLETAETHRLAWDSWCAVLEDLHDVMGERPMSLSEASSVVVDTLSEATVGLAPPTLDQVLISSIERSRHPDVKHAWLMAFNDGIFPAAPAEDVLLRSAERTLLSQAGLKAPRPKRDDVFAERMLAYIALTRPSLGLRISYARTGVDGSPRAPSPLLADVFRAAPEVVRETYDRDAAPACLPEFARGRLAARAARSDEPAPARRYEALYDELRRDAEAAERLERMFRGLKYDNAAESAPGYASGADVGAAWSGSHSELNQYIRCPFRHFASYALRLRETARAPSIARELGQRAHNILSNAVKRAIQDSRRVREIADRDWVSFLDEAESNEDRGRSDDYDRRHPQLAFLAGVQRRFIEDVLLAQAGRWRLGDFEPLYCERSYELGEDGALQALELKTAGGEVVRLKGVIDRIDRAEHDGRERLLVYDYKTSGGGLSGAYLTQARLQTAIYMLAIARTFGEASCAGAFLAPLLPSTATAALKGAADWPPEIARMQAYRPRGLFDMNVARLLDRKLGQERSPVAAMQLTKDGQFNKAASKDVIGSADLKERMRLGEETVLQAAGGIIRGEIDVSPLVEKRTLACTDCEYARLCRFEPIFNRPRLAEAALPLVRQDVGDQNGGDA